MERTRSLALCHETKGGYEISISCLHSQKGDTGDMEETNTLRDYLDYCRYCYCLEIFHDHKGHITNAAKALGIHRNTLTKILNRSRKDKP